MNENQEMQFADPAWELNRTQGSGQEEEMPPPRSAETFASFPTGSAHNPQQAKCTSPIDANPSLLDNTFSSAYNLIN